MNDIFTKQILLQKRIKNLILPIKDNDFIRESALGIFTELGEALAVDKSWKTWKNIEFDESMRSDLREEIADIWLFLTNYTLANGMSYKDIINEISKKQKKNFERFKV